MNNRNYNHTIYACYVGYIVQAIINNLAPLLFITFQKNYGISLEKIAFLITFNFGVQLFIDLVSVKFVDRIGYRTATVMAHILAFIGLMCLAILPGILSNHYLGIIIAVVIYAIGGGLIEVVISPLVEACPTEKKEAAMSLLHSFYCWGHVLVVVLSTAFFTFVGIGHWKILVMLWAIVPLANAFIFMNVPVYTLNEDGQSMPLKDLFKNKIFWLMFIMMLCAGASEQGMSQWASAFAESGLKVSKTVGDLAGPCMFAILMGSARAFYGKYGEKIKLESFMKASALLCIASYLATYLVPNPVIALIGCGICGLSVGIFWPGTFSLASKGIATGGTAMFALLALAGDVGCAGGPTLVGVIADHLGGDLKKGIIFAIAFPTVMLVALAIRPVTHRSTK